jgi:threonine synthase
VNSINWARVLAQVVYYFTSAVSLGAPHRAVSFTVPTGNFGDIFAGYIARRHGPADREACRGHEPERHPAPLPEHRAITCPMA